MQRGAIPCKECAAGTATQRFDGAESCVPCNDGELCEAGTTEPILCPAGSICPSPAYEEPCREGFVCANATFKLSIKCAVNESVPFLFQLIRQFISFLSGDMRKIRSIQVLSSWE